MVPPLPARPAGHWPVGLRVGAAQPWLGWAASWALWALGSCSARPLAAGGPDSDSSFICSVAPIPTPACPLATMPERLWRLLSWPGHWWEPEAEWGMAVGCGWQWAAGPVLALRGPGGPHPALCPSASAVERLLVSSSAGSVQQGAGSRCPKAGPLWFRVGAGALFLSSAGFSSGPGLEALPLPRVSGPGWTSSGSANQRRVPVGCLESHSACGVATSGVGSCFQSSPFPKVSQSWWVCLELFFPKLRKDRIWLSPFPFYFSQWDPERFRTKPFSQMALEEVVSGVFWEVLHLNFSKDGGAVERSLSSQPARLLWVNATLTPGSWVLAMCGAPTGEGRLGASGSVVCVTRWEHMWLSGHV